MKLRRSKPVTKSTNETGSTLIEVLLATVILSVSGVAILAMTETSLSGSAEHRSVAVANTLLGDYAESLKYQIEQSPSDTFVDCPTPATGVQNYVLSWYQSHYQQSSTFTVPAKYSVSITAVAPWNNSTLAFDTNGCPTTGTNYDATGLQRLTLTATGPSNVQESMTIVVRNPAFNQGYANVGI